MSANLQLQPDPVADHIAALWKAEDAFAGLSASVGRGVSQKVEDDLRRIYGEDSPRKRLWQLASECDVPREQLNRFLSLGYVPQPRQLLLHAAARTCDSPSGPTQVGFGGARGGSKTHGVFAQVTLDDCQRRSGLKFLFLRKVLKSAREAFDDLRLKVLAGVPHEYNRNEGLLKFPNGSRVVLGHYRSESDIDAYLGIEYDGAAIEEATQLSEQKDKQIRTCIRTSRNDWRPRLYKTSNPGGVGHSHFKRAFIDPHRKNEETDTRFIFSFCKDNVFLNAEYIDTLEDLSGWLRAAWLEGDWDIAAGQFFSNWRYERIVIPPFDVPAHWPLWASLDYGYTHPTAAYLMTEHDGTFYILAESVRNKKLPAAQCDLIKHAFARVKRTNGSVVGLDDLAQFVAGDDVFAHKGDEHGKTIAAQYQESGITLARTNIDRIARASKLVELLGDDDTDDAGNLKRPARIKIFNTCRRLIECIPSLVHDPNRPEDVLKVDADEDGKGGDDEYDGMMYGIMSRSIMRFQQGRARGLHGS